MKSIRTAAAQLARRGLAAATNDLPGTASSNVPTSTSRLPRDLPGSGRLSAAVNKRHATRKHQPPSQGRVLRTASRAGPTSQPPLQLRRAYTSLHEGLESTPGLPGMDELKALALARDMPEPSVEGSALDHGHNLSVAHFLAQQMARRMVADDYLGAPNLSTGPWNYLQHDTLRQRQAHEAADDSRSDWEAAAHQTDRMEMDPRKQGAQSLAARAHTCYDVSIAVEELAVRHGFAASSVGTVESERPGASHGFTVIGDTSGVDFSRPLHEWPGHLVICDLWGGINILCAPSRYEGEFDKRMARWQDRDVMIDLGGGAGWVPADSKTWRSGALNGPFAPARSGPKIRSDTHPPASAAPAEKHSTD